MISFEKLELFEDCLNQLDYDNPRGWNLVRSDLKGRRKKVIEFLLMADSPSTKELSKIFNISPSNMKQVEYRSIRALSNVLKMRSLSLDDFIETE
jgi:DNA-directed RNA polymerase sigma subunit (sigma70/sigma32)